MARPIASNNTFKPVVSGLNVKYFQLNFNKFIAIGSRYNEEFGI